MLQDILRPRPLRSSSLSAASTLLLAFWLALGSATLAAPVVGAQEPVPPVPAGDEAADQAGAEADAASAMADETSMDEETKEAVDDGEDDGGSEDESWNVDEPPGPYHEVTLDLTEGTWMSLDVSPDGREIVFDLLGDLYTVPLAGGEATPITRGFAWDMQPRFSPDGHRLAFTSDRGGGDNVWVMERDGEGGGWGEPRPVTDESYRLVNSPAWSPDGDWIAVRKHFTSQRSLGAGEIWLYHRAGGKGLQMTERPNDQKDVGEPAFSPDGRYVYFSQDTTPGPVFEYNKDPNPGIYTVRRLDRENGEIADWIDGAGGAVRPTPSPDGRRVAFVRRVRGESTLWLKDVASGAEWQLAGGLDRDMQETWAVHGVYPSMAWTPDSASVVYWAGGGLHRVDAVSGVVSDVPFHVHTTKKLTAALRFPVDVHPARFRARMLRWVGVSPDGSTAMFEALGKIWLQALPDGTPRRLTTQDDHFELWPAFSRDGRQVVYVSWDDQELAAVRLAPARPGAVVEGRAVTSEPGHYAEPALSPDGSTVVYRKMRGGWLTGTTWSAEPGLYSLPAAGGEPVKLSDEGVEPHFGAAADRVYFLAYGEEADDGPKRLLKSIGLDGLEERTHAETLNATDYRVSPDGRWLAWRELFQVYVAPLVATGRTVALGPESEAVPVAQVSSDAGSYLSWSGDSASLHWSLGPQLFTRPLTDAFAFLAGAPETLPEPPTIGVDLVLEAASDVPAGSVALVGARVITLAGGTAGGGGVIDDGVVVVEGDRIRAVGARGEVSIPAGARTVDVSGKTIIPGLVDVHWHGPQGENEVVPQGNWVNGASLGFGVTTIHDPSNDTSEIFAAAELQRAGEITGPHIFSTGTILYGASGSFKAVIDSLEDARHHLRRMKAVGAISVKSYNQPRREQRQQVIQAARESGMMVVPEGGSLLEHNLTMVADGHTGIEHAVPPARLYDDVLQFWGASDVGYTPTLIVGYGGVWGESYWYAKTHVWEDERLLSFVPRELVDARSRRRVTVPDEEWGHFYLAEGAKRLHDAGVEVQVGAHGQREGLGAHWEMWMLAQGGMTPLEALVAGTLDGARYLGLDGDVGSLEAGKLADLAILDADPLADVRNTRTVRYVMVGGRLYDAATLNQLAPDPEAREPYWWQRDPRVWADR